MKKFVHVLLLCVCIGASAQSYDERIAEAMNNSDWFGLDAIYSTAPKDSVSGFLDVLSRCLIGNRLNRPDVSIPAFQELFGTQSLDLNNLVSSTYMFGIDLSRVGQNEAAAQMTNSVLDATKQYLDSATIEGLTAAARRYQALAAYDTYQIDFGGGQLGTVPFAIVPVGPEEKGSVLMHLRNSRINGVEADITFDTGAGLNVISPEMAEKFNLTTLDGTRITVKGVDSRDGCMAIAADMKIGTISVRNVPFMVVSMSSNNDEADKYIDCFNIVVGSELMLQLKDLTIDFINREISVPAIAPVRSCTPPDLCFSSGMNLLAKGSVLSTPMLMRLDSGDASFGSLGKKFFDENKDFITTHAELDTVREAGLGGTIYSQCYKVPYMPVYLGGSTVSPSELTVKTSDDPVLGEYGCNLGIKTLMLFGKVRFNLVDMVLTTDKQSNPVVAKYSVPEFRLTKDGGPGVLQTIGYIAVGVARMLINPYAVSNPDL